VYNYFPILQSSEATESEADVRIVESQKFDAWRFSGFWEVEFGVYPTFVLFNSAALLINCAP